MKITELKKYEGIFNYVGFSSNFFEEYEPLVNLRVYCDDREIENKKFVVILFFKNEEDKALNIKLSSKSYFNIKYFIDSHTQYIPSSHKLFNIFTNFTNTKILAGIVPGYDSEHYLSYLLLNINGKFICTDCYLTDILCITQSIEFPVFFHQELIYKLGTSIKDMKYRI